ncbi:hypothetical protein F7725_017865 [Dissostichus mawsoni]|uniref:Uncharacterized protein n=1 Tax=Dissostichus mawsoni TaxID=36200 RepID=A0A7J5XSS0_DISMA|nr:hypothetical protein F7725_017865 [Dissostichus mawsoni]
MSQKATSKTCLQEEELKTRNQELETKTNNLTQQIQDMTTNWNELNIKSVNLVSLAGETLSAQLL